MKQFDLTEYLRLKEEGKEPKIVTRDGRNVRIICTDKKGSQPVVALVWDVDYEYYASFHTDGCFSENREVSTLDLFFAPVKRKGWVNVIDNGSGPWCCSVIFQTEKDAKRTGERSKDYVTTVPIEWEERL